MVTTFWRSRLVYALIFGICAAVACSSGSPPPSSGTTPSSGAAPPASAGGLPRSGAVALTTESSVRAAAAAALKALPAGSLNAQDSPVIGRLPEAKLSLSGGTVASVRIVSGLLTEIDERELKVWIQDPGSTAPLEYLTFPVNAETRYCDGDRALTFADFRPGEFVTVWAENQKVLEGEGALAFRKGEMRTNVSAPYLHLWADDTAFPALRDAPFVVGSLRRGLLRADIIRREFKSITCYQLTLPF